MKIHLLSREHNLSRILTTAVAVSTLISLASLLSQSLSGATHTYSRFLEDDGESGEDLIGDVIKVSIDIAGVRAGLEDIQMAYEMSVEGSDRSGSSFSSNNIVTGVSRSTDRLLMASSAGSNEAPVSDTSDPGSG